MHTEHLQRVRFPLVATAWFVAVAVAALMFMAAVGLDLIDSDSALAARLQMATVAVGFFAGGLFAGLRAAEAPILHGIAIGLLTLAVWFVLNVLSAMLSPEFGWDALTPAFTISLVLIQIVAAVVGARTGYRIVLKGRGL